MTDTVDRFDLLDMTAIAELLGYPVNTVRQWRKRGILPTPDANPTIGPLWYAETVDKWAAETGRVR